MAATSGHRLTLDPMAKCSNAFFPETTNMIKAKLYMNVHWMVLYKLYVFCSDMKFKMVATAGRSLTLDPMGKMFQNASSLKPLGQLKPNCPGIIICRSSKQFGFFMPIGNPRWLPPQVIVLTQDHMGKYRNILFSEAIALIESKLCINHWKVLYTNFVFFYVDLNSKMTTTAGHTCSFYIGPIGSFYNQVNDTGSGWVWAIL